MSNKNLPKMLERAYAAYLKATGHIATAEEETGIRAACAVAVEACAAQDLAMSRVWAGEAGYEGHSSAAQTIYRVHADLARDIAEMPSTSSATAAQVLLLPGAPVSPEVVLHRTLDKKDSIRSVVVVIGWSDGSHEVDWSAQKAGDLALAALTLQDTALGVSRGEIGEEVKDRP